MGGEEAKTGSLDNSFKEFCSIGGQRKEAVSGKKCEVKRGRVCLAFKTGDRFVCCWK